MEQEKCLEIEHQCHLAWLHAPRAVAEEVQYGSSRPPIVHGAQQRHRACYYDGLDASGHEKQGSIFFLPVHFLPFGFGPGDVGRLIGCGWRRMLSEYRTLDDLGARVCRSGQKLGRRT
jgi:hypothetical protein